MADRYALFGHPVSHSRSPDIHRSFAEQTGEAVDYELIDVAPENFATRLHDFFANGGSGCNITLPYKLAAFEIADTVSSDAFRAGAVNTLALLEDGSLFGDNTDGAGLVRDITVNCNHAVTGRRVLLIGAGGAARGAVGPLLDEGPSELVIANRHTDAATALADLFQSAGCVRAAAFDALRESFDVVINATSASLHCDIPEVPDAIIATHTIAYDMFYSAQPTVFQQWAGQCGATHAHDGWGMMVEQAAESFFIWRGVRPDTSSLLERRIAS